MAEDLEELVPEGLLFAFLAGFAGPGLGEADGAVADFVPGKRHIYGVEISGREGVVKLWGGSSALRETLI